MQVPATFESRTVVVSGGPSWASYVGCHEARSTDGRERSQKTASILDRRHGMAPAYGMKSLGLPASNQDREKQQRLASIESCS